MRETKGKRLRMGGLGAGGKEAIGPPRGNLDIAACPPASALAEIVELVHG